MPYSGRCYFCRKPLDGPGVIVKYGRAQHRACDQCPKKLKTTPVGGLVGNKTEGLYRIVARIPCTYSVADVATLTDT